MTDTEVISAMRNDFVDSSSPRIHLVERVMGRKHFRTVFDAKGDDFVKGDSILNDLSQRLEAKLGVGTVRLDWMKPKQEVNRFPVIDDEEAVQDSTLVSHVIAQIPPVGFGFVFAAPENVQAARWVVKEFLQSNRKQEKDND